MSSILSRFKAIFQAQANSVVDKMEDPRVSLDYSLSKLEDNRRQMARSLVEVTAARHRLEAQNKQMSEAMTRYESQAKAALEAGRDDLARLALERKQEVAAQQAELETSITSVAEQADSLRRNESTLDRKIALFRSKKEELKAIYDSSKAQLEVREAVTGISEDLADVGNTIQRAEARIREMKSRADAIDELVDEGILSDVLEPRSDDIDHELAQIGRRHAIDQELERLKAEVGHE